MTFKDWLREHHYRETTIVKTFADLKRAQALKGPTKEPNVVAALRRYITFAEETGLKDATCALAKRVGVSAVVRLPHEKAKGRKLEARSFDAKDWATLRKAVAGSTDPRDQVLWAIVTTGIRIGDALKIPLESILRALKSRNPVIHIEVKGGTFRPLPLGIREPWIALARGMRKAKAVNVAAYVADGDDNPVAAGAAYFRTTRRFKTLKRTLGLEGRAHTHRIRRTIAVGALNETDNIVAVQQMLGHASMNSTAKYVDEANLQRTAKLQRKLAGIRED
jgi:integrase